MKNKLILGILMVVMTISCRDNSLLPLDYHQGQNFNGAYLRTVNIPSAKLNLVDFANSYYEIVYEAGVVDASKFESVSFTIQFIDNTKSNGVFKRAPQNLPTVNASSFAVDPTSKLPRYDLKLTGQQIIDASTIPLDSVTFGDTFQIVETIHYAGQSYSFNNTSADLTGGPYYGSPFLHIVGTGDPLSISMTWDGGQGYCKSVDLDLYLIDATSHEVDGYVAASSSCPEKTSLTLAKGDGDYYGSVNPYDYAVQATDITPTFTFSQPGKASVTFGLVDSGGNKINFDSTAPAGSSVFYAKNGHVDIEFIGFKIVKTGPNFDVYDGAGVKKGSFGL